MAMSKFQNQAATRTLRCVSFCFFVMLSAIGSKSGYAKGLYQTNQEFLAQAFPQQSYQAAAIWIKDDVKQVLLEIFDRPQLPLRQRYWRSGSRTAWIMNEIGKELPITIGVVINQSQVEQVSVLAYRESRGGEIRHAFFTRQFNKVSLGDDHQLSSSIDGITGATLSVTAMKRVVAAALYLHQQVVEK